MNILILSPFLPWPLDQGGKIRIYNIIKNLAPVHTITLAAIVDDRNRGDVSPLHQLCDEVILVERPARLWPDRLAFFSGHDPYNIIRYRSADMRRELKQLLSRKKFDLVQIEFSMMWQYADLFADIPVVLDAHNIEHHNVRQIGSAAQSQLWRTLYRLEEKRLRAMEERAWRECALCFTVSEREREEIAKFTVKPAKVITAPNGVDPERFSYRPRENAGRKILFLGGMDYTPNLDAASWFLNDIFPLILRQEPETKLLMVGRELWRIGVQGSGIGIRKSEGREQGTGNWGQESEKSRNKNPGFADTRSPVPDPVSIEFHENVAEVLPWFYEADVLVVPLRQGAGTRIKVLEAMAAGLPVVSTSKGCEGIAARDGEHLLAADSAEDFAVATVKVFRDAALGRHLANAARLLVEERYTWESTVAAMEQGYKKISDTWKAGNRNTGYGICNTPNRGSRL
jgi:glycosyltransferase involved in cell wall biosynthesis